MVGNKIIFSITNKKESLLINHFATCEKENLEYTNPKNKSETLINTYTIEQKASTGNNSLKRIYMISGGFDYFEHVIRVDHKFLEYMLKGINLELCFIHRLDLFIDLNYSIMEHISHYLKYDHYFSNHRRAWIKGWVGAEKFKGPLKRNQLKEPNF